MTLPASGAISLNQICTEFNLPLNSTFPTAFYGKGGAPTSGALSVDDFWGRSGGTFKVTITGRTYTRVVSTGATTSASVTATAANGTGPYTYSWAYISGSSYTINSPTSASTAFTTTAMASGVYRSAVFRCTATDTGSGGVTTFADVTIEFERSTSGSGVQF